MLPQDGTTSGQHRFAAYGLVVARAVALSVALLALAVLIGWALAVDPLKRIRPGLVAMNPLTAVAILLSGASCWIMAKRNPNRPMIRLARLAAAAVLLLGLLRVIGYMVGADAGLDLMVFARSLHDNTQPGPNRMAPNTAGALTLLGAALVLHTLPRNRLSPFAPVLVLGAALPCILALIGYANGVSGLSAVGIFIPMALHTAIAILGLCVGTLCISHGSAIPAAGAYPGRSITEGADRSVERKAVVGFAAALMVMLAIGIASNKSIMQFAADAERDDQSQRVLMGVVSLGSALKDAETGGRGYVITGKDEFLEPYTAAIVAIGSALTELRSMTTDSPAQQQRVAALEPLIAHRLALLDRSIDVRRDLGFEAAQGLIVSGEGKRAMDEIRQALDAMHDNERELLAVRSAAVSAGARATITIISLGSLAGLVFVGVAAWMIRRDMTVRLAAERATRDAMAGAEAANQAKGQFLAHMSHEIRTPLNGVMGMADLLLGTELSPQQRRYAELVKGSGESLTRIINDILDFSKIEAGKLDLESMNFNLHTSVEDVMEMLAHRASAKGLELACHVDPAVPAAVTGDPDRLRQVLVNLVNNAIKFTEFGAVVLRLSVDSVAGDQVTVRFAVTDTGVGIPRDRMDRLFRSFSQVDASTTRLFGGTGLGLAISKQLAELMGGQIGVESAPDKGSTFWFTARLTRRPAMSGGSRVERINARQLRVLAVDDNDEQREVLCQQIASWGMDASAAPGGPEALLRLGEAASSNAPFRVAIVDSEMPGMDGPALARAIKERADIRGTVLMILLTMESHVDPSRLRDMGFAGHMTKPVRQSQLFDAIMSAIAAAEGVPAGATPQRRPTPTGSAPARAGSSGRVLLAEDNEVNQLVAVEILAKAGFACDIVVNGKDAVEAARTGRYDVILMDCQMPVMDGFQATRAIRELERDSGRESGTAPHIPIIALTANAMRGDREQCLAAGMDAYASKPIDPKQLVEIVRMLCPPRDPARSAA